MAERLGPVPVPVPLARQQVVFVFTHIVFFSVFAGLANVLNIPFFKRDGGLLSYSKFAAGVKLGITVPSRLGMTLVYFPAWE